MCGKNLLHKDQLVEHRKIHDKLQPPIPQGQGTFVNSNSKYRAPHCIIVLSEVRSVRIFLTNIGSFNPEIIDNVLRDVCVPGVF